jgi:hypothetical protein
MVLLVLRQSHFHQLSIRSSARAPDLTSLLEHRNEVVTELWPGHGLDLGIFANAEASGNERLVEVHQSRSSEVGSDARNRYAHRQLQATKAIREFVS